MTKARVPLWGKPNGFVVVDPTATPGAVVGQNLLWPDGRPVTEAQLRAVAQPPAPGTAVTYWRTIMEVPPNVVAVAALDSAGFVRRTGDGVWSAAAIANPDLSNADTDGLAEGSRLYFTAERARTAAVADEIDPAVTDVAPSQRAVAAALEEVIGEPGPPGPPGKDGQIRFTGNGPPGVIVGAEPGDTYMDLITGDIFKLT